MGQVNIYEVGPRDGFQNLETYVDIAEKKYFIDKLVNAGVSHIQITSFVNPKAIPQMRDATELASYCVKAYPETDLFALVPNLRGAKAAWDCGIKKVSVVVSLSESHNKANINRSREESVIELKRIKEECPALDICIDIATAFGCPFEGMPKENELFAFVKILWHLGFREFCICDTIGAANPKQVRTEMKKLVERFPEGKFMVHIHDTRGMGLACTLAAIEAGIDNVQTTLGGLGGCPFAPGASGNTSTEDLVFMLHEMGYRTGIDSEKLLQLAKYEFETIEGNYSGHRIRIQADTACAK